MKKSTDQYYVHADPQALRESARRGVPLRRAPVPDLIRRWRQIVAIDQRSLWRGYGFGTFAQYCQDELGIANHEHLLRRMSIARLDPLRFRGCVMSVGALILAAGLGDAAQRTLADGLRRGRRRGIIAALEEAQQLDDAAAAQHLEAWLSGEEQRGKEPAPLSEEPPHSVTSLCRRISVLLQERARLTQQLTEAVAAGDLPTATAAWELRAQLKEMERMEALLLDVIPEPKPGRPTNAVIARRSAALVAVLALAAEEPRPGVRKLDRPTSTRADGKALRPTKRYWARR